MYSQHSSENPTRIQTIISHISQNKFPKQLLIKFKIPKLQKTLRSVIGILLVAFFMFTIVFATNKIESSLDVGFEPDFQNQHPEYSSVNQIFEQYTNTVTVNISMHGKQNISVYTPVVTIGEIISKLSLTLDDNDVMNYALTDLVEDNMLIEINRIETKTYTETESVPYSTQTIESQTIPKGTKIVVQKGVEGSVTRTITEKYINGNLDTKTVNEELYTSDPVEEIVKVGVGGTYTDSKGNTYAYSYYIDVTATAYGDLSGVTATGNRVKLGTIAVDPSVIPLGTKVYLTGSYGDLGVCMADDTGGAIKGNKIDVYLGNDYWVLRQFGRRSMRVYILE